MPVPPRAWLLLLLVMMVMMLMTGVMVRAKKNNKHCRKNLNTLPYTVKEMYCDQPLFVTFLQKTDDNLLLDNVCHTYFPLPDDSTTFQVYHARVYCDGSSEIITYVGTVMEMGVSRFGSPYCTFTASVFGFAGCDTFLVYECHEYGSCSAEGTSVFGLSKSCRTIGLSCLRKVEEIVQENRISARDYYVLPMKLPNRCVTEQICLKPSNPFYSERGEIISTGRHSP